jgi:hypothetical protein
MRIGVVGSGFGGAGVVETLPIALDSGEQEALARSAAIVRRAIDELEVASP